MTPTPFVKKHAAQSAEDGETWEQAETARTLTGHQGAATLALHEGEPEVRQPGEEVFGDVHPTLTKVVQSFEAMGGALVEQQPVAGSPRDGYEPTDTAASLMASSGRSGGMKTGTRNQSETLVVVDTYNQAQVHGDVSNTLTKSPVTAVETTSVVDDPEALLRDPSPDGRRWAACGDGVAAPVAHWIGLRLRAVMEGRDPDAQ